MKRCPCGKQPVYNPERRYDQHCAEHDRLATNYNEIDHQGGGGDVDYCLHELAHYVVVFGKPLRRDNPNTRDMQWILDDMPRGRAQVHELRTIALEAAVLPWVRPKRLLNLVWIGIRDVADDSTRGGRDTVKTKADALRRIKDMHVSPRLKRAYARTIEEFCK